jgi:hypothetical protein
MPRYAIIGVEGPHDQAFVSRALIGLGFRDFSGIASELDPFWVKFTPTYPKNGRLYVRMDMPSILYTSNLSIAVYAAEGNGLKDLFPATFVGHPPYREEVAAFGIIADADKAEPARVAADYATVYRPHFPQFPDRPGTVDTSPIRTGIYVLPDNVQRGVLETLVIPCGDVVYPKHMNAARGYLKEFAPAETKHWKPFDAQKALVATVASVLQPGATNTVTIKFDKWLTSPAEELIRPFANFLKQLLNLS